MSRFPFQDMRADGPGAHWYNSQAEVDQSHKVRMEEVDWCFKGGGNPWLPTTVVGLIKDYFGAPGPSECIVVCCLFFVLWRGAMMAISACKM
jgi:hypothetical protein